MSKEYEMLEGVEGKTAYLIGVTDGIRDNTINSPNNTTYPYDFDSDVFFIGENNNVDIIDAVKERLIKYQKSEFCPSYGTSEEQLNKIGNLRFDLIKDDKADFENAILIHYGEKDVASNNREVAEEYIRQIGWFFHGKVLNTYHIAMNNEVSNALQLHYNWFVFNVTFVEFEKYMLMIIYGCND